MGFAPKQFEYFRKISTITKANFVDKLITYRRPLLMMQRLCVAGTRRALPWKQDFSFFEFVNPEMV